MCGTCVINIYCYYVARDCNVSTTKLASLSFPLRSALFEEERETSCIVYCEYTGKTLSPGSYAEFLHLLKRFCSLKPKLAYKCGKSSLLS